ncbi:MAG: nucleotidyltransferase domain-containing protein [Eubacterium sp.]|jgi:predicted nucleotidyltransferase|nr:nucleotidyltransferase domain-containing protein [Eubacterium sp.]
METGIKEEVLEEINQLARKYDIKKVILFGSRARADFHKTSDIDLAVSGGNKTMFYLDVEEKTSTLLMFDMVDLDADIQPELRDSIVREGVVIYEEI